MSPAQPSRKLFGITAHFSTQLFQSQSVGLFVPGQLPHDIVWTGNRIVAEELDHSRDESQIDGPAVFPLPDR